MPRPLIQQICFSLYSTSMAVNRLYKPMLDAMGITYPQYLTLTVLGEPGVEKDGMTIGTIAERLMLESSTVTPLVKRMEQAKLVARHRGEKDERQVMVRLTAAGRKLLLECDCLGNTLLAQSGMTEKKIGALNREIQDLRAALAGRGGS